MVKEAIKIFARLKPTDNKNRFYDYQIEEDENNENILVFNTPKDLNISFINNKKDKFKFRFGKVFEAKSTQDQIFDNVAKPVIENVLEGYNGTIFAYGQTGSGKTYTMTGGGRNIHDRGIIMRTIEHIYQHYLKKPDMSFKTRISYLEIYNDNGYDLLDPKQKDNIRLDELPKVVLMEDSDQNIHLRNLSVHETFNEDEARNLLFIGDINRVVAETPMNISSTRSHCIFTLHISSKQNDSALVRNSKLHLVDLAGSERVSKTGVNGLLLNEAKFINLSLHHLEQVIIALSEKGRSHIPYRNSLMTSVLRDSLGGNCMTSMIATCSLQIENIEESISTCRFAQRVALIKNQAELNEQLDDTALIEKLKFDVQRLKNELSLATGVDRHEELTENEIKICEQAISQFLSNPSLSAEINIDLDMRKIHLCFRILKQQIFDNHNKYTKKAPLYNQSSSTIVNNKNINEGSSKISSFQEETSNSQDNNLDEKLHLSIEEFTKRHHLNEHLATNKLHLKELTHEAKVLGAEIKQRKDNIEILKTEIEKYRTHQTLKGIEERDERENTFLISLKEENIKYNQLLQQLRNIKSDVDQTKHLIERNQLLIQKDYNALLQIKKAADDSLDTSQKIEKIENNSNIPSQSLFPMTGDSTVDDDIKAFLEARNRIKNK